MIEEKDFSVHERIKHLRDNVLQINQKEMATKLNLQQGSLSDIERKRTKKVTDRVITDICREFDVNEEWLRYGTGETFIQLDTFSLDEKAQKNNLTELEIDIMKGYMDLPPATRDDLMALFSSIYGKHAETAASLELTPTPEQIAEQEAEAYRQEILAELKTQKSSALDGQSS